MAPDPIADDDQSIGDDVVLWRGITPEQIKPDGAASDGAFRTKEMSVFIAVETDRAAVLAKLRPGTRLRRFTARDVRDAGGVIRRAPAGGPGLDDDEAPGDLLVREPAQPCQDGRVECPDCPVV